MVSIEHDPGVCRQKTVINADLDENGKVAVSVTTLCQDVVKVLEKIPTSLDPEDVVRLKYDVLPELMITCGQQPGLSCPFIMVAYKAIEAETRNAGYNL